MAGLFLFSNSFIRASSRTLLYPSLFTCLARAIAIASSSTSFVIVDPAAIYAFFSIVTGATKLELQPINAWSPIFVRDLFFPS